MNDSTSPFPLPPRQDLPDGSTRRTFAGTSSPGDWPEDFAHENGSYLCTCVSCHQTFTGHKRRYVCKVCHERDDAEQKCRAEFLHAHGAPKDWVIFTADEVKGLYIEYANALLSRNVERKLRRELAREVSDLVDLIGVAAAVGGRIPADHPRVKDALAVREKSDVLDAEIAEKEGISSRDHQPIVVTVNGSPAEFDPTTGTVLWRRAVGSFTFNVKTDAGRWSDDRKTWTVDGKTVRFSVAQ